jgi:release factor glutamine methyltransferase
LHIPQVPATDVSALVAALRAAGCVFAEEEAELILATATDAAEVERMVAERVSGLPLEQVVGWASFHGVRVLIDPDVFVPRRRTEHLVDEAILRCRADAVVVDLCCGSGALGLAVATAVPGVSVYAADLHPAAVRNARRNLPSAQVFEGDLYDALPANLRGRVDILLANVPYVPTGDVQFLPAEARLHEPRLTLDGGPDGLTLLRRVATEASLWLAPGGYLFTEASAEQAPLAADILAGAGLKTTISTDEDDFGTTVIGAI